MSVKTHTHHHVTCDLCPTNQTISEGGDIELHGWLIVVVARPGHPNAVRSHVCPICAQGSKLLSKLVEPLGAVPIPKELLS